MSSGGTAANVKSVQKAKDKLTKFLKTIDTVPVKILEEEAAKILNEVRQETPYRTGKLERSAYVRVSKSARTPRITAGANAISKGYNYAYIQHENTRFRHPIKGKAHYVSDPYRRGVKRIIKRLRSEVKM